MIRAVIDAILGFNPGDPEEEGLHDLQEDQVLEVLRTFLAVVEEER